MPNHEHHQKLLKHEDGGPAQAYFVLYR